MNKPGWGFEIVDAPAPVTTISVTFQTPSIGFLRELVPKVSQHLLLVSVEFIRAKVDSCVQHHWLAVAASGASKLKPARAYFHEPLASRRKMFMNLPVVCAAAPASRGVSSRAKRPRAKAEPPKISISSKLISRRILKGSKKDSVPHASTATLP